MRIRTARRVSRSSRWPNQLSRVCQGLAGTKRKTKRPNTVLLYDSHLGKHILPTFGSKRLSSVHRSDVQAWANERADHLAPSTLRLVYGILASIFRDALSDRLIAFTPCNKVELRKTERREAAPLTPEQVCMLAIAITERYRALIVTAAGIGLRMGELFGLTVDRTDFLRRLAKVDRQLIDVAKDGEPVFGPPKTETSARVVPLPQIVVDALAAHIAEYGTGPNGLIFTNAKGKPVVRRHFYDTWGRALTAANLPNGTRFHAPRHTFASLLIDAKESPKVIQARLGHKSITETTDTYGHLYPGSEDSTRAAIDAAFSPGVAELLPRLADEVMS